MAVCKNLHTTTVRGEWDEIAAKVVVGNGSFRRCHTALCLRAEIVLRPQHYMAIDAQALLYVAVTRGFRMCARSCVFRIFRRVGKKPDHAK